MEFHFEGLDVPLSLPDEYLSVRQYERLQVYAESHPEIEGQLHYIRGALAAMLGDEDLLEKTDDLPMSPENRKTWEQIDAHIHQLIQNLSDTGENEDPLAPEPCLSEASSCS